MAAALAASPSGSRMPVAGPSRDVYAMPSAASSSNARQPPAAAAASAANPPTPMAEPSPRTLKGRFKSTIESSIRRSKHSSKSGPAPDDRGRELTKGKSSARPSAADDVRGQKEQDGAGRSTPISKLARAVSSFRSSPRAPPPVPGDPKAAAAPADQDVDYGAFTPFQPPSLRGASMSSPTLTLSASAAHPPRSRPSLLAVATLHADALAAAPLLTRDRSKRTSLQPPPPPPPIISGPSPLRRGSAEGSRVAVGREPSRSSVDLPRTGRSSVETARPSVETSRPPSRDPARRSKPPPLYPTVSTPSVPADAARQPTSPTSPPETPKRRPRDLPVSPATPTPPGSRVVGTMRRASASSSALPLSSTPSIPEGPGPSSPTAYRARSPSTRRVTPTRGLSSSSASHLPLGSSSGARRPSFEAPRPQFMDDAQSRRTSLDANRPSLDSSRPSYASYASELSSNSPATSRAASPRGLSPDPGPYQGGHAYNASSSSLASTPAVLPEHRELLRAAASLLCRELGRSSAQLRRNGFSDQDWEEIEVRMRNLVRLERIWGKGGLAAASASGSNGEERERRAFCEALRDGYVLCQFMNKLRPGSLLNPSTRDDGFVRTSNVTRFLATCTSQGVPSEDLFHRDDLIEASAESLARVARSVLSLFRITEAPLAERSKIISGGGEGQRRSGEQRTPYGMPARAAESTPNLALARSTSPTSTPTSKKRWSPPTPGLPTVMDHGSDTLHELVAPGRSPPDRSHFPTSQPPRSPLRTRSTSGRGVPLNDRVSVADSTRASLGESVRESLADSFGGRQSLASSQTTDSTAFSSLLEVQRTRSGGSGHQYGTMRTFTTEGTSLPSEAPSFGRADSGSLAASLADDHGRKQVDLTRVVEENEASSSATSSSGGRKKQRSRSSAPVERERERVPTPEQEQERAERIHRIRLGKAKWPDDFIDAFGQPKETRSALAEEFGDITPPLSTRPSHTSLNSADAPSGNERVDALPHFSPKRPTHRARHSVDTAILPKPARMRDERSPDGGGSPQRAMLKRSSTTSNPSRPVLAIRSNFDERSASRERPPLSPRVPFPRTVSGDYAVGDSPVRGQSPPMLHDRPRLPRGRFTSEVDGASSRRRPRPNSFEVEGAKPGRSRFESMVNLGAANDKASASDLLSRDSVDIRQTLVVKEDGKPAIQYQLGNCIGRGQFGSVYRALNLTTGQMVAVKRIRLEGLKEDEIKQLMREVDLVRSLSHPGIVKYEGMARDANSLSIVLEFAENGSLGQTLKAFGKLNERLVASYVVKILDGLHYLHQSHVVHCDLKAANILTTKTGNVKLSDFGVSLNLRNLRQIENERKDVVAGTPNWMAPEVIELKGASYASDIWSLGCTVVELLTGRPPYADILNSMSVMFRIVEDDTPPLPDDCSEQLRDFLGQCFQKDPTKRPTAEMLCEHEWLKHNWVAGKELRQQDSIPFLRRVSTDLQSKPSIARYLGQIDAQQSEAADSDEGPKSPGRRQSNAPSVPPTIVEPDSVPPREHSFVRTTFGKAMTCKVCQDSVKKSAVICETCSLIAHQKCACNAPPTCDLRAQLLLYASYAGSNAMAQAADYLASQQARNSGSSPPYDSYIPSPRTSFDVPPSSGATSPSPQLYPPTAFKVLAPFKRSRSSLSFQDPAGHSPATPTGSDEGRAAPRRSLLKRNQPSQDRPLSISSGSSSAGGLTNANTSSMRSAATAAESFHSAHAPDAELGRTNRSAAQPIDVRSRSSRMTIASSVATDERAGATVPGGMPADGANRLRRQKTKSSSGNCAIQ